MITAWRRSKPEPSAAAMPGRAWVVVGAGEGVEERGRLDSTAGATTGSGVWRA